MYNVCFSLSDFLQSVWQVLGPFTSLQMTLFQSCSGWVVFHYMYAPHLLYPFICHWTFRLFPCPGYCKSAAMNTGVHVSFWIMVFSRYMSSSGIAGSYGSFIPSFLRNLHTVLHSGCINLHPHQQYKSSLFFSPTKTDIFVSYSSCWKLGSLKASTHKTHSWIKCGIH